LTTSAGDPHVVGPPLLELGANQFTLAVEGPDYDLSDLDTWINWRDRMDAWYRGVVPSRELLALADGIRSSGSVLESARDGRTDLHVLDGHAVRLGNDGEYEQ
jgi:hypothetical protein